jgi:hypothetical protein
VSVLREILFLTSSASTGVAEYTGRAC